MKPNLIAKEKILVVIPARGGSKSIKEKNIKRLNRKPLITYTINAALKLKKFFYKIIVSTDNKKIAKISKQAGCLVPFIRPKHLSKSTTPTLPVIKHALKFIEKKDNVKINTILTLQPTSPLRTYSDIKNCLNILKKNKECDSVVSVVKANEMHPIFMKSIKRNYLNSYLNKNVSFVRRQDIKPNVYRTNGAIYISRRDLILKNKNNLLYGNKVLPFIMPKDKSIDIDEELDFLICKAILNG